MELKFKIHAPKDPSDPGFSIPGAKLRWISGRVRESSGTSQMWIPLRKEKLPKALIDHVQNCFPNAFSDGSTIRRGSGELILAYSTEDVVAKHRKYLDSLASEQVSRARLMPKSQDDNGRYKNDYAKIETYEEGASSIPRQFLNDENKAE